MGGCGLPKVPRKTLPLAWKYSKRLVPSDSLLQDCSPCLPATTGLSSPGDQREAETHECQHRIITTASDCRPQSWIRSTGTAQLVNADIALAEKKWGDFYFLEVTGKCLLGGKVLSSELVVLVIMLPAFA